MVPIMLSDDDRRAMPPHTVHVLAEDQPAYVPLPIARLDRDRPGRVYSRWTLTDAERQAIAAGADLYLEQMTFGKLFQPIRPALSLPALIASREDA